MSEDAATAARRIVAEVLGQHDVGNGRRSTSPAGSSDGSSAAAAAPVPTAAQAAVPSPDAVAEPPPTPGEVAAAPQGDVGSTVNAATVARNIVAQVLADADAAVAESGPPPLPTSRAGVAARGPEPDDAEQTPPTPPEQAAAPRTPAPPATPAADASTAGGGSASAADIVRRIVSDVMTDAAEPTPSPARSDASTASEDDASGTPTTRVSGRREPTRELLPPPGHEDTRPSPGLESERTREVPRSSETLERTQQVRRQHESSASEPTREAPRQEASGPAQHPDSPTTSEVETASVPATPETAVSVLDHRQGAAGHPPEVENDGGFEATVVAPVSLSSRHEPLVAPPEAGSQSETGPVRWLMISILGALALAVLFPMAVAALRALVALS